MAIATPLLAAGGYVIVNDRLAVRRRASPPPPFEVPPTALLAFACNNVFITPIGADCETRTGNDKLPDNT